MGDRIMKDALLRIEVKRLWVLVAICLGLAAPAFGENRQFAVTWSGAGQGNAATATAIITIDDTVLLNPGQNNSITNPFVVDFRLTVTGAAAGDGHFGLADFGVISLETGPGTPGDLALDFSQELVGQDTGADPWGTPSLGGGGDFNLAGASPGAPTGMAEFLLCANGGIGDCMELTSFKPVHTAWLKLKVQTKGMEFDGTALLGKVKLQETCYLFLQWEGLGLASGSYYCETTPGTWVAIGGTGAFAWNAKTQLLSGSCGLVTATASLGGVGFFTWNWKTDAEGALQGARVRTVGGYMAGTVNGGNGYYGDCKITGSRVPEEKVPPEAVAASP
jgi:hypothetical protein